MDTFGMKAFMQHSCVQVMTTNNTNIQEVSWSVTLHIEEQHLCTINPVQNLFSMMGNAPSNWFAPPPGFMPPFAQFQPRPAYHNHAPALRAIQGPGAPSPQDQMNHPQFKPDPIPLRPPAPSDVRMWEQVVEYKEENLMRSTFRFKVMSYNILAQLFLDSTSIMYEATGDMAWSTRSERIFNEIKQLDPDVICIQELQQSHISFCDRFTSIGYIGIYKKKTGGKIDGCAIFYKTSKFTKISDMTVEFRCPELSMLTSDNIAIMIKLTPNEQPDTPMVVATTHLVYNPCGDYTRLAQMRVFLSDLEKFSRQDPNEEYLPIILTGDFNATPSSFLIKLLDEGCLCIPVEQSLNALGLIESPIPGLNQQVTEDNNEMNKRIEHIRSRYKLVKHPFSLSSVYELSAHKRNERKGKSKCRKWKIVDYIYFSRNNLKLLERLQIPTHYIKIPNKIFASDHLSMVAVFELQGGSKREGSA